MSPPSPPRQTRSRETLARVLAAAKEVFVESGGGAFSVPAVSRRAGVSVGTIYRRFATKEDLLIAVLEGVRQDDPEKSLAAWDARDWSEVDRRVMIAELIDGLSRTWREEAPLMRAMMARRLQTPGDDQVFAQAGQVAGRQATAFRAALLTHRDEIGGSDPERRIDFAYRMIVSASARWTAEAFETRFPERMGWDEMLDNLADLVEIYVFGPDGG
ncbi:MAG: TetR/AcrR family transcriptional regulator [Actinobacteria bacterium]|nr:TetR/AcrR family transcriptional regulator [Actinomycetota bacterium]